MTREGGGSGEHPDDILLRRIAAIEAAPTDDFVDLVLAGNIDTKRELHFGDFAGCRFDRQSLQNFNLTGCNLDGASFVGATLGDFIFDGARVERAALKQAADYPEWLARDLARPAAERYRVNPRLLRNFDLFREAPFAPAMVALPAGAFDMGSDKSELTLPEDDRAFKDEIGPRGEKQRMNIARRFALGRDPVTFEEYDAYCAASGKKPPSDESWGRGDRPVINVNWTEANAYINWLNLRLGRAAYRLPSETEWEYACRAGTNTRRWWGDGWDATKANGAGTFEGGRTSPVGTWPANPWGLRDMLGNVYEWCADEYREKLADLLDGGGPWMSQRKGKKSQSGRVLRGGSWVSDPRGLRAAYRVRSIPADRNDITGFRVARTLAL